MAEIIDVTPLSWNAGDVLVGDAADITMSIEGLNDGAIVDSTGIIDDLAGAFSLADALIPPMPVFLDGGDFAYYDVTFTPPEIGSFSATPRISSTDFHSPSWDLPRTDRSSGVIPEPSSLVVWSLIWTFGTGVGWWRRRRTRT